MSTRVDELLNVARCVSRGEIPPYQHNESYTSGAFDLLVVHTSDGDAFRLLKELCARFPSEQAECPNLKGYYQLLSQLARQTNTTEMPEGMREVIVAFPELSGDLRDWYHAAQ